MALIPVIPPVKTKTVGGMDATVFEIDTDDLQDGINGVIYTQAMGDIPKSWSDGGICSNAGTDCNLDPHAPEVAAVIGRLKATRP